MRLHVLFSAILLATGCSAVLAGPLAYVPNEKSASLSVIDTATDQRVADIAVGERPRGIAGGGWAGLLDRWQDGQFADRR